MEVLVVGPGAMGSLFAVLLADAGVSVRILDHDPQRASILNETGITVNGVTGRRHSNIEVVTSTVYLPEPDLIFFWVKAYDTESAAHAVQPAVGVHTTLVTLQNGLGNTEILARMFAPEKIVAGVTSHGATLIKPGLVYHAGSGETVIGSYSGADISRVADCRDLLAKAGLETSISSEIETAIWGKLTINAAINPLTAITGLTNGELLDNDETMRLMKAVVEETVRVTDRLGITLPYADPFEKVVAVCRSTARNRSSMLQDVIAGKRTEIDQINGAIVAKGRELGVSTPVNWTLTNIIKARKRWSNQLCEEG